MSLVLAWARIEGCDGHMTVTANEESMVEGVSRDTPVWCMGTPGG